MGFFHSFNNAASTTFDTVGTTASALNHVALTGMYKAQESSVTSHLDAAKATSDKIEEMGGREKARQSINDFDSLVSDFSRSL